jgi:hypothetical protein
MADPTAIASAHSRTVFCLVRTRCCCCVCVLCSVYLTPSHLPVLLCTDCSRFCVFISLSCLVLYTPQAGRTLRAGGWAGPPPPPQYMLRRALASPRVGARITRVRFSTKSNYLSHFLSHLTLPLTYTHLYSPACVCQSSAVLENLRAHNQTPHPSRCALPAARCLHLLVICATTTGLVLLLRALFLLPLGIRRAVLGTSMRTAEFASPVSPTAHARKNACAGNVIIGI